MLIWKRTGMMRNLLRFFIDPSTNERTDQYDENRADLEKDRDDEEFMAMYEQYEAFDELEEQFMDMEESVTARIAEYVDNHIEEFAEIV